MEELGNVPMKRCSTCGKQYPETAEHFSRSKTGKNGLQATCKACQRLYNARYRAENADKIREHKSRYYAENADKEREKKVRYYAEHVDKMRERSARNRSANPEYRARYNADNADKIRERKARYCAENVDKERERHARYRAAHPEKKRQHASARRARERGLPAAPINEQYALDYFNGCCAVCGKQADFWTILAMDHWIAVSDKRPDNPGTVPTNMIPLCHSVKGSNGQGSCNHSKGSKDPAVWLTATYNKRRAKQILARIEAYFASLT